MLIFRIFNQILVYLFKLRLFLCSFRLPQNRPIVCEEVEPVTICDQFKEVVANTCLGKRHVGPSGGQLGEVITNCDYLGFAVAFCDRKIVQYFNSGRKCLIDIFLFFSCCV